MLTNYRLLKRNLFQITSPAMKTTRSIVHRHGLGSQQLNTRLLVELSSDNNRQRQRQQEERYTYPLIFTSPHQNADSEKKIRQGDATALMTKKRRKTISVIEDALKLLQEDDFQD